MIFHNIISELLGGRVQITVLKLLFFHEEGLTGRGLANLVGCSTFKMQKVLEILVSQGLVTKSVVGRAHTYRTNGEHILMQKVIRPLIDFEKSLFSDLGKLIMKFLDIKPLSIILYGSVARGDELPNSDLDLFLIYGNEVTQHSIRHIGDTLMEVIPRKYGNPVSIRRSCVSDFQNRANKKDPLIRNIIREGRVIAGLSLSELLETNG